jgi:hypothetical protein
LGHQRVQLLAERRELLGVDRPGAVGVDRVEGGVALGPVRRLLRRRLLGRERGGLGIAGQREQLAGRNGELRAVLRLPVVQHHRLRDEA